MVFNGGLRMKTMVSDGGGSKRKSPSSQPESPTLSSKRATRTNNKSSELRPEDMEGRPVPDNWFDSLAVVTEVAREKYIQERERKRMKREGKGRENEEREKENNPPVPEELRRYVEERGGSAATLVMEKNLEKTDLSKSDGRLSVPFSKVASHDFLKASERERLELRDEKGRCASISTPIFVLPGMNRALENVNLKDGQEEWRREKEGEDGQEKVCQQEREGEDGHEKECQQEDQDQLRVRADD